MTTKLLTTREVAERFQCSRKTVVRLAADLKIGTNLGGSAGFRFTEAEVEQMYASLPSVGAA